MSKRKWTDEQLIKACAECKNKTDVLLKLGLSHHNSGNYQTVTKYIKILNINIDHFIEGVSSIKISKNKFSLKDILIENSEYSGKSHLKKKLLDNNLLENKCYGVGCGINSWLGNKLNLHLDHINGKNDDNRIENLRFLCPNCHSQTETYCRGERRKRSNFCDCGSSIKLKSKQCFKCDKINRA